MKFTFKKGNHSPQEWWQMRGFHRGVDMKMMFNLDKNAHYYVEYPAKQVNDTNKLFGFSVNMAVGKYENRNTYGLLNSIRVGWDPSGSKNYFDLWLYVRNNGAMKRKYIANVPYNADIIANPVITNIGTPGLWVREYGDIRADFVTIENIKFKPKLGVNLRPMHGGDNVVQNDYTLQLKHVD